MVIDLTDAHVRDASTVTDRLLTLAEATLPSAQRGGARGSLAHGERRPARLADGLGVVVTSADRSRVRPAVERALSLLRLP